MLDNLGAGPRTCEFALDRVPPGNGANGDTCGLFIYKHSCLYLCSDTITCSCPDPSQSQSGLIRCRCSVKSCMPNRRMPRPSCESGQLPMSGAAVLSLKCLLLSLLGLLRRPQSTMIKFMLNSQFLHFWCVSIVFPWGTICKPMNPILLFSFQISHLWSRKTVSHANSPPCREVIKPARQFMSFNSAT